MCYRPSKKTQLLGEDAEPNVLPGPPTSFIGRKADLRHRKFRDDSYLGGRDAGLEESYDMIKSVYTDSAENEVSRRVLMKTELNSSQSDCRFQDQGETYATEEQSDACDVREHEKRVHSVANVRQGADE